MVSGRFARLLFCLSLIISALFVSGCERRSATNRDDPGAAVTHSPPTSLPTPTATRDAGPPNAAPAPAPALTVERVRTEIHDLLASWSREQDLKNFEDYIGHYHRERFTGVRRTKNGKVREYDVAGWENDRAKMFRTKASMTVDYDEVRITTWLDPGSRLESGISEARFIQRFKSGSYADHGPKLMRLLRDSSGVHKITYEDMLASYPGWRPPAEERLITLRDELMREDHRSPPDLREQLLAVIAGLPLERQRAFLEHRDCVIQAFTAAAFARRGDRSHLVRIADIATPHDLHRFLCQLQVGPENSTEDMGLEEDDTLETLLLPFKPPSGAVLSETETCDFENESAPDVVERETLDWISGIETAGEYYVRDVLSCGYRAGTSGEYSCFGGHNPTLEVKYKVADNGRPYVSGLASYQPMSCSGE